MSDERDEELVSAWMRELATLPLDAPRLPDPAYLWWKAQLLKQWDAQRTATAPLEWGEHAQVATGLVGAAILLAVSAPHLPILATIVLIATAALAIGWWRLSLTSD
jgi:hypothetical protein